MYNKRIVDDLKRVFPRMTFRNEGFQDDNLNDYYPPEDFDWESFITLMDKQGFEIKRN